MKKTIAIIVCLLILCSIMLVKPVARVKAGNAAYSITEYLAVNTCWVDGKWTWDNEWTDTVQTAMSGSGTGSFGYLLQDYTNYGLQWIVEFYGDNTNDTSDYWQICLDDSNVGGAAPQTTQYMIQITGHTNLTVYQGTGSGWAVVTPAAGEITWANTIASSPWNATPHWILEVVDSSKSAGIVQMPNPPPGGMRVAAYDATTQKLAAWAPSSSANVPNGWGLIGDYSGGTIPENIGLPVVLLASSVAVLAAYISRKRPKTTNPSP